MKIRLVFFIIINFTILKNMGFPLQITEIFYRGNNYISSDERYIEIYNETDNPFPLSNLIISIPRSDTITTNLSVLTGTFEIRQTNVITNSLILPPHSYAVILSKYNGLFCFSPGTLVLKPKNQSFIGWSWSGRLHLIQLYTNNISLFNCGNYYIPQESSISDGKSLSFTGEGYSITELSPGINNYASIFSQRPIVREGESVPIFYKNPYYSNSSIILSVECPANALNYKITLTRSDPETLSASFYPPGGLSHGSDILFSYESNSYLLRYLEKKPFSSNYQNILINEIVSDPQTDYSGGGWSGQGGGGTIDSTDEWVELVNRSDSPVNLSNCFILYKSKQTETVKKISFRTNSGMGGKSGVISNYGYLIITPEDGVANNAVITLYDGHPYHDGRILDEVEYGTDDLLQDGTGNNAPSGKSMSIMDEAIVRIPNAVYDPDYSLVFKKQKASFCMNNGSDEGLLWVKSVTGLYTNIIFLIDSNNTNPAAPVLIRNEIDREGIILSNYGIYFKGSFPITVNPGKEFDGILNVKNGSKNQVVYQDENPAKTITAEFLWGLSGWNLPSQKENLNNVIVYPNPLPQNQKISLVFANLPEDVSITFLDLQGNCLKTFSSSTNGMIIWETSLKKGIYLAVFKKKNTGDSLWQVTKKLLVK